jgi:hypothetical protein
LGSSVSISLVYFAVCVCADSLGSRGTWCFLCAAAMGATFAFTDSYVANLRQQEDALNGAAGGCAAGLLAGARGAPNSQILSVMRDLRSTSSAFDTVGSRVLCGTRSDGGDVRCSGAKSVRR